MVVEERNRIKLFVFFVAVLVHWSFKKTNALFFINLFNYFFINSNRAGDLGILDRFVKIRT